jgi:hypothetical protein
MAKTSRAADERRWVEAQRRCRLSDEALRMANELGLNPTSLIKNIPSPKWSRAQMEVNPRASASSTSSTMRRGSTAPPKWGSSRPNDVTGPSPP